MIIAVAPVAGKEPTERRHRLQASNEMEAAGEIPRPLYTSDGYGVIATFSTPSR